MKHSYWKRILAISMGMVLAVNTGLGAKRSEVRAKEIQDERVQTYIVRTETEKKMRSLDSTYEEGETISDLSNDNMGDANFMTLELSEGEAEELSKDSKVAIVEPDYVVKGASKDEAAKDSGDEAEQTEWNLQAINFDDTDYREDRDNKVKVALIDSGVDLFNDIDVKESINLIPGEENIMPLFWDISGHGTSIAGVIAAKDNGEGITGINPNVELYSARVLDEDKSAPVSRVVEAIYWAIEKKVNIISLSFGMTVPSAALETAVKEAYDKGILIVAAAGNHGVVEYPAAMDEVMAVGGTDTDGTVCDYSAEGEQVEIVAPAEKVKATAGFDGVMICNGTSMAVPHVVGAASKLWERDLTKPADFIRQLMDAAAKECGDKESYGNGFLDYQQALEIYDEFEKSYQPWKTVEENKSEIEKNESPVEEFTDVEYVNGSWEEAGHQTLAQDALKDNGYVTTGAGNAVNANIISAVKMGAVYPDKKGTQNTNGMTKHPCLHGYFITTGGAATCNYIFNYIKCTEYAKALRGGKTYSRTTSDANNAAQEFERVFSSIYLGSLGGSATNRAAFAYGVAIHTATDVFSHSVWTKDFGRLFHDEINNANKYADNPGIVGVRFEVAKDVAVNIISHYKNNTVGTADDFCNSSKYCDQFKLYNFQAYLNGVGRTDLGTRMANYSC